MKLFSLYLSSTASVVESSNDSPWVVIILALISASGVILTGFFSFMAQKHAKVGARQSTETNDAVNHKEPGQDRLFDMVANTRDIAKELLIWKSQTEEKFNNLGEKLDNRVKFLHDHIDDRVNEIDRKFSYIDEKLNDHMIESDK